MKYEVHIRSQVQHDVFIACKECTDLMLSRLPAATAAPLPAGPKCELQYEVCSDKMEVKSG
jgi:hypothetical protein